MKQIYKSISRHFVLITTSIVVITVIIFGAKYFIIGPKPPYPSLEKQRATLSKKKNITPIRILDSATIINDFRFLSSDTCEGRSPGSKGHEKAVERIVTRMRSIGLDSFSNSYLQTFEGKYVNRSIKGKNIIGSIKGTIYPEKYIAITAHFDHLGKIKDSVYYGASDNASGTACILAMAEYFKINPSPYSLIFVAFDREERGLEGSLHFVDNLPNSLKLSDIKLNLNVDMITRNDDNEIFACGLYHYPSLIYAVNEIQSQTNALLLMGHDKGKRYDNWTNMSDHFAFHQKKIPFLYFGVEDHIDYHRPTDTFDKTNFSVYIENCNMITQLTKLIKL